MAEFTPKNWLSAGESGATDSNSVLNKENMNDLENRIAKLEESLTKKINNIDILNFPKNEIPENADLNDYTTIGVYASINYSSTLKNCPHKTDAFKLIVERVSVSDRRVRQTVMANNLNCNTYVRYLKDTWSSWYKINMTAV